MARLLVLVVLFCVGEAVLSESLCPDAGSAAEKAHAAFGCPSARLNQIARQKQKGESGFITGCSREELRGRFRTIDGRCNNRHPDNFDFGAVGAVFQRILPNSYQDGRGEPRKLASDGKTPLPSPRLISRTVHETEDRLENTLNHMLMQWGQFLDHDITHTPQTQLEPTERAFCSQCNSTNQQPDNCFPIPIPAGDPVFPAGSCLRFVRSENGQFDTAGPREQMNQLTSYIDASNVYGSDKETAEALRAHLDGLLKIQKNGLLPEDENGFCASTDPTKKCFLTGEVRANVQLGLVSLHNLWVLHHNHIAQGLKKLNPHWDDERLYQETRRIIGAQHQHITYSEFLPEIIGKTMMDNEFLTLRRHGHEFWYDPNCEGTIHNEFATAAFRFGHSTVHHLFRLSLPTGDQNWKLAGNFFNPTRLYEGNPMENLRGLWKGLTEDPWQAVDRFVIDPLRNHLFGSETGSDGLDLIAFNIQRGRDHGLRPYVDYLAYFKMAVPRSWADLEKTMLKDTVEKLKLVYQSVADVDLYSGLISERTAGDASVGPLLANLLAEQFINLKYCDRFWYENGRQSGSFNRAQLHALRAGSSLTQVLCTHSPEATLRSKPFAIDSTSVSCSSMTQLDLRPWREGQRPHSGHHRPPHGHHHGRPGHPHPPPPPRHRRG